MRAFADVHTHNFFSTCSRDRTGTAARYIEKAAELGLETLGFSNHVWDERAPFPVEDGRRDWYYRQSLAFSMQIKTQIPDDTRGVRVLIGAETEYCGMYDALGMTPEGAAELDYLLVPHSHTHMRDFVMPQFPDLAEARRRAAALLAKSFPAETAQKLADRLSYDELEPFMPEKRSDHAAVLREFLINSFGSLMENESFRKISGMIPVSVAHPFQPVNDGELSKEIMDGITDETLCGLLSKAAKLGVGIEINPNCGKPEYVRFNRLAKECGCKFTPGSDTHSAAGLEAISRSAAAAKAAGITREDMMEFLR